MKLSHGFAAAAVLAVVSSTAGIAVRGRPIEAAPEHAFVAPPAVRTAVDACWLELARNEAPGQAGTAGFTSTPTWDVTVSSLVVKHPKGVVAIDVGNSSRFRDEVKGLPFLTRTWLERLPGSNRVVATAPEAMRAAGIDPAGLRGVILTHAHVDHAGGLVDLPGVPVLVAAEEARFFDERAGKDIHVVPAHAAAVKGRIETLTFEKKPYATFDESADVFGDGAVVVVKLGGHTPGSVGVFVNVTPELRMFHVGDAVNLREAIVRRRTKSVVMASTDVDRDAADRTVATLAQLREADPWLKILPAHDRAAWAEAFGAPGRCISK